MSNGPIVDLPGGCMPVIITTVRRATIPTTAAHPVQPLKVFQALKGLVA